LPCGKFEIVSDSKLFAASVETPDYPLSRKFEPLEMLESVLIFAYVPNWFTADEASPVAGAVFDFCLKQGNSIENVRPWVRRKPSSFSRTSVGSGNPSGNENQSSNASLWVHHTSHT